MDILFELDREVGIITINKPESLNILTEHILNELDIILRKCGENNECKAIIITGSGNKYFSAGADVNMFLELKTTLDGKVLSHKGQKIFNRFNEIGKPSIAAINGIALGGGCEIALACTFRIATLNAKFGLPEIKLGIIPGWGGTQRLARLIGETRAMEFILSGDLIDAKTAYEFGMVNRVVPSRQQLLPEAQSFASNIIRNSPVAIKLAMESIHQGLDLPLEKGLLLESNLAGASCLTAEAQKGVRNLLKKKN